MQAFCQTPLDIVARHFDSLSLLNFRSNADFVCVARAGESVYQGTAMEVGTRRPLISSAGGVAILIALPGEEAQAIVVQNKKRMAQLGPTSLRSLEKMIRRSQRLGFSFNQSETARGVHAFGIPLRDAHGDAFASLTLAGPACNYPAARAQEVVDFLKVQAAEIELEARRLLPQGVYKMHCP